MTMKGKRRRFEEHLDERCRYYGKDPLIRKYLQLDCRGWEFFHYAGETYYFIGGYHPIDGYTSEKIAFGTKDLALEFIEEIGAIAVTE